MQISRSAISRAARWAGPAAASAAFAHALALGWRCWGDPLVDTGRELAVPARLLDGALLYADVRYYYGPLAPYVNALLYGVFGVHADVLVGAGIASAALAAAAVYLLAARLAGPLGAAVTTVAFAYVCAFGHLGGAAIFNFALPYTFAATYGMVAALWSLVFLLRHVDTGRDRELAASVVLLTLASLAKVEAFVPALAAHLAFALAAALAGRIRPVHLASYGAGAVAAGAVYVALFARVGAALWGENLAAVANDAARPFILRVAGLDDPRESLVRVLVSALVLVAVMIAVLAVARLAARRGPAARAMLVGTVAVSVFVAGSELPYAPFPVLPGALAGALVVFGARVWRQRSAPASALVPLLATVFALAALPRILLRPSPDGYGFYLLPASLAVVAGMLFRGAPAAAAARAHRPVIVAAGAALFLGVAFGAAAVSRAAYAEHTLEIAAARGRLRVQPKHAAAREAVSHLAALPPHSRVAAVPEGIAIPFLAGLEPAGWMSSYLPMELPDAAADARLVREWAGAPPDFVLWAWRDMPEFGYAGFGVDYAAASAAYLVASYRPVRVFSPSTVLLARRPASSLLMRAP